MQGVEAHFPFFCQRYGAHGVPLKDWGCDWDRTHPMTRMRKWECIKDLVELPDPNYREPRYTGGLHRARKFEEELIDGCLSYTPSRRRFDTRFVDFVCDRDDDPILFDAIARVAQWIRDGQCEQLNKFLAVHKIKAENREKQIHPDEQEGQLSPEDNVPDSGAHESDVTAVDVKKLLIAALDAVGHEFLARLKASTTDTDHENGDPTGNMPAGTHSSTPKNRSGLVSFVKPTVSGRRSVGRGIKRKGQRIGC